MPKTSARTTPRHRRSERRPPAAPPPLPAPPSAAEASSLDAPLARVLFVLTRLKLGKRVTATTVMKEFQVSRSTVVRDFEYMKCNFEIPFEWDVVKGTYVLTGPCDHLPVVVLGRREALALALAGRVCDAFHGVSFGRLLDTILKKVTPMFGGAVSEAVTALEHVHTPDAAEAFDELESVLTILDAIAARQCLSFDYSRVGAAQPEARSVEPLHLVRLVEHWRLIARLPGVAKDLNFRLSRMRNLRPTGATFVWPEDFDPKQYLTGTLGAFLGGEEHEVRLALDARAAAYAREHPWHSSQKLTPRTDGRTELTMHVSDLPGAMNLVLRWGSRVEVLAPEQLRNEVRDELEAAAASYGSAGNRV